jgi:hypothetical protein
VAVNRNKVFIFSFHSLHVSARTGIFNGITSFIANDNIHGPKHVVREWNEKIKTLLRLTATTIKS